MSTGASKKNQSDSVQPIELAHTTETPSLIHDSSQAHSTERNELSIPNLFDRGKQHSEITSPNDTSSLQELEEKLGFLKQSEELGSATVNSVTTDTFCQTVPDHVVMLSYSTPTPPGSASSQLDRLLFNPEEIKLTSATHGPFVSGADNESPEVDALLHRSESLPLKGGYDTEDNDSQKTPVSSTSSLGDVTVTDVTTPAPASFQTSIQAEPEIVIAPDLTTTLSQRGVQLCFGTGNKSPVHCTEPFSNPESSESSLTELQPTFDENKSFCLESFPKVSEEVQTNLHEEDFTSDVLEIEQRENTVNVTEEISSTDEQSLGTSYEDIQTRKSPLPTQPTPEPFEDLELSSDKEESLTPEDDDRLSCQSTSVTVDTEIRSSTSDEKDIIPHEYEETPARPVVSTLVPPHDPEVVPRGAVSPTSDPEPYFDCRQVTSDLSETEPDEQNTRSCSCEGQPQDHLGRLRAEEKVTGRLLFSSGSEDYEDASFVYEPTGDVPEERDASEEEFTLCEAPFSDTCDDSNDSLTMVRRGLRSPPPQSAFPTAELQ